MLILSLDSAGGACGVCVWRDGAVLAEAREAMERGQDRRLMPLVMETMRKSGVEFAALDRIAVTRGPGSFTGIRIGLAAARGLGLALKKPVIGIDRFAIYRAGISDGEKNLLVVIDSKRLEAYCGFYPISAAPHEPCAMTPGEISHFLAQHPDTLVAGDAMIDGVYGINPTGSETAICAGLAATAAEQAPAFLPRPLYIRPPDVTLSRKAV